jgi:hypothetical protein
MAAANDDDCGDASDELRRLMTEHPALFAGKAIEIPSDLPRGWYPIADRLCVDLEELLGDEARRFQPIQSNEKWGSWRFYWCFEGEGEDELTVDIIGPAESAIERLGKHEDSDLGQVQVSPTQAGYRRSVLPAGKLPRAIHERVREAERETERTCMWCGKPGEIWTTGWVHIACAEHRRPSAITLEEWRHRRDDQRRKPKEGDDDK